MKKFVFGAAAAAFLMVGASSAMADERCGALPNAQWDWRVVEVPLGEDSTSTSFGQINYSGNSGNGFADVTTTTSTAGLGLQCTALNPAGKEVADKNTTVTVVEPSTVTNTETGVQVCENSPNGTDLAGDLCR